MNKQPDDIADEAFAASKAGNHRDAERLFLLAAERAAERTASPTMQKHAQRWDKCAARERRLAELTKV